MSNSELVTYKLLSPNHSGKRTMAIDRITPHCVVGQLLPLVYYAMGAMLDKVTELETLVIEKLDQQ